MYNNNSYYEAPYDDQAEHDELAEQIYEYMKPGEDFDPSNTSNMGEAISQSSDNDQEIIRDFIQRKEWDKLGAKLFYMTHEYMEKCAEIHLTK
jgi:hypothetical protein